MYRFVPNQRARDIQLVTEKLENKVDILLLCDKIELIKTN